MSPFHSLSSILLVISLSATCLAFRTRTRRSSLAGYDDPYGLTNALHAMDRERRRSSLQAQIEDSILGGEDDSYFNPNSMSDLDEDYIRSMQYLQDEDDEAPPQYYPGYNFEDSYQELTPLRTYPAQYGNVDERMFGPKKRTAFSPHRVSPDLDQLRNLFGEANVPRKRMAADRMPDLIESEENIRKAEEDTSQLAHKLVQAATKLTETEVTEQNDGNSPEVVKDVKFEKLNPDGTTTTLEEVFKGAETEENSDDTADTPEDLDTEKEESELINNNNDITVGQTKTKRASSEPCAQESVYIGELLIEIAKLRNKVAKLESEQILEDKENDLLADALVYSTLDQLGGGNDYVDKEYKDISKATDTEELIQLLASDDETDGGNDDIDEILEEYIEPSVRNQGADLQKRSDEEEEDLQWYDRPLAVGDNSIHVAGDEDDNSPDGYLGGEMPINVPYPDEDAEDATEEEEEEEEQEEQEAEQEALEQAVEAVENEVAQESEEANKVDMLRSLLQGLSPKEMTELIDELQEGEEALAASEDGVCPAAMELSENCAFAEVVGIPIDTDARNLCIRHQLCYTCGSEIGISREGCDEGYKKTAVLECEGDADCMRSAALFLGFMGQYHTYGAYGPQQCAAPCLEEFIVQGK